MDKQLGNLYIVGVGPGSSAYLTMQAKQIIEQSDVIAGYELSLNAVRESLSNKKVLVQTVENQNEMLDIVAREREIGKDCSILRVGDPCYSSGIKELLDRFKDAQVIPGISSIQVAAAKLGLVLEEVTVLTFHTLRGDMKITKSMLLNSVRDGRITIVLVVADFMPQDVANFLISGGIDPKLPVTIFENLSLENERIFHGGLSGILKESFTYLSVMVIGV
ncbi:MAG: precorrin-6y C5,15-methyltransferase (decarboxylating) subunit CbiE [Candidatus Omnitrophota bacterium]|nr:precorrin-6y C5,15-methyltransferase (decarboxylating) subunit CbiE [Candidatus Omnitrophota bacterium]